MCNFGDLTAYCGVGRTGGDRRLACKHGVLAFPARSLLTCEYIFCIIRVNLAGFYLPLPQGEDGGEGTVTKPPHLFGLLVPLSLRDRQGFVCLGSGWGKFCPHGARTEPMRDARKRS